MKALQIINHEVYYIFILFIFSSSNLGGVIELGFNCWCACTTNFHVSFLSDFS